MKAGDEIKCPHCGADTFLKKVALMDGWAKKGDIFACAACSAKIADITNKSDEKGSDKSKSRLSALLGTDEEIKNPTIKASEDEKTFCKDCIHFIKHPFNDKCGLHDRFVNPMDDCIDFKLRKTVEK